LVTVASMTDRPGTISVEATLTMSAHDRHAEEQDASHGPPSGGILHPRPFWVVLLPVVLFLGVTFIGTITVLLMAFFGGSVSVEHGPGVAVGVILGIAVVGFVIAIVFADIYWKFTTTMFRRWEDRDTRNLREHLPEIANWPRARIDNLLATLNDEQRRILTAYLLEHAPRSIRP